MDAFGWRVPAMRSDSMDSSCGGVGGGSSDLSALQ